jgi:hypothetical protein
MDGTCSKDEEEMNGEFLWGYLREKDHLKDPSLDGRMILKFIFKE